MWITAMIFPVAGRCPGKSQGAEWICAEGAKAARHGDSARPLLPCSAMKIERAILGTNPE
jgi:hypothetical protein